MTPTITAFASSPDRGRGLARDMPVRWALEEVGQPYEVELVSFEAMKAPAHRARQPFGQIPTYQEGDLVLFESGAIVLHVAGRLPGLLPEEPAARARAIGWMFAALSTIEQAILYREIPTYTERDRPWFEARKPILDDQARRRLADLSDRLGRADWLDGAFSAGDLLMVQALRRLGSSRLLEERANLAAYVARGEARPAFRRAFAAQRAAFEAASAQRGGD
ncbi:MAG: glutathione S-transferase family protein [Alphaproteobacteria bacterium]|nr:glutathione S-transferase family protein [Alphaproteobacteria bacterium]